MKILLRFSGILVLLSIFAGITNCTKEGVVGPQGTEGSDGSTIYSGTTVPAPDLGREGDYYYRVTTSDFYGPKLTEGWGNPTNLRGAVGEDGQPGDPGPTGPSGANGTKIWSGTAMPATSVGAVGDFYFQTGTANFYGPKTGSGWGTPVNLKGAAGSKGENGSIIISGAAVPTTSVGAIGDYYFRALTGDFYGPKTNAGWGTPTSLKGATGATGTAGATVLSGTATPTLTLGRTGDFYVNISNADFYGPKTTTGWGTPLNLRGPAGPQGPPGKDGEPGTANVIYSNWYLADEYIQAGYGIPAPQLTQAIVDRGQILVYRRYISGKNTEFVEQISGESSNAYIYFMVQPGNIFIYSSGTLVIDGYHAFRYVLIPGSIQASAKINFRDFNQVKVAFNIPD
ncbi:hypothetical protein FAZ15_02585 [Sphingobacterium olei]|uniref:Collagen-like protein n=1 Tax=Sphingobacterium olei TaxID=2571155 RepID=A0A4V5MN33_9SPHI|nr:hypothetical protein [Sphingobacterium olei]TJZ63198.1 hypothetical protein FAZ15_02585 [Sphingobacterium olei]